MKNSILFIVFFSCSLGYASIKDSINYHEIKDAIACFDCINRNREMLWQVIAHLERLDSYKVTTTSRGSFYFDLSMAYAILTEIGENYFHIAKLFAYKAIHYGGYPAHYLHMATLYHKEGICDSMKVCLNICAENPVESDAGLTVRINQLRNTCVSISK